MVPLSHGLVGIALAVLLTGCPDPDDNPTADMRVDQGTTVDATSPNVDAALPDAALPDAALPDAALPDAALPDATIVDAMPPDATPPNPTPIRTTAAEVCAGCGVAKSADFTVIQRIVPRRARIARSADFTLELMTAPIAPEPRR